MAVVVDDASPDDTAERVRDFAATSPLAVLLLRQPANGGAAAARNLGVAATRSEFLFHLDADDEFLPDHIAACLAALRADPDLGWVKTRVELSDPVHPGWQAAIEGSLPINLALRRACHQLIGGFEDPLKEDLRCEDVLYCDLIERFFNGRRLEVAGCRHYRAPGNSFDRQYERFRLPPEAGVDALTARERAAWPEVVERHQRRIAALDERFKVMRAAG